MSLDAGTVSHFFTLSTATFEVGWGVLDVAIGVMLGNPQSFLVEPRLGCWMTVDVFFCDPGILPHADPCGPFVGPVLRENWTYFDLWPVAKYVPLRSAKTIPYTYIHRPMLYLLIIQRSSKYFKVIPAAKGTGMNTCHWGGLFWNHFWDRPRRPASTWGLPQQHCHCHHDDSCDRVVVAYTGSASWEAVDAIVFCCILSAHYIGLRIADGWHRPQKTPRGSVFPKLLRFSLFVQRISRLCPVFWTVAGTAWRILHFDWFFTLPGGAGECGQDVVWDEFFWPFV